MASAAYRPELTQAPYVGFGRPSNAGFLQVDLLVREPDGDFAMRENGQRAEDAARRLVRLRNRLAFKEQYERWLQDSLFDSLPERMTRHDSYKAIVAQGERVVPLIAAELRKEPSFLFLALEDITNVDPVPADDKGDLNATVAAWLSWLRR